MEVPFVVLSSQIGTTPRKDVASCMRIPPRWKVVFLQFSPQKETKKAEQGTHYRNLAVSTEEKDAVAFNIYSKQNDAKLTARNP